MPNQMTTDVKVPELKDYGIDPKTGFLPSHPNPLKRLSGEYFEPWESLLDDISHHLVAWKLRSKIEKVSFNFPELIYFVVASIGRHQVAE